MRLFVCLWFAASAASACSCIQPGTQEEMAGASVVFRGVAKSVTQLPARLETRRPRYAVTFSVSDVWKGNPGRKITINYLEPGPDCLGAHFDTHTEYVVFAKSQKADDYKAGDTFLFGWLDLMPKGTELLTVDNYCNATAPVKKAGNTLRALGNGRAP
jgi:hypothetical protein